MPRKASPPKPPPPPKLPPSPPPAPLATSTVKDVAMGGQLGVQPIKRRPAEQANPEATARGAGDDGFRSPPHKKTVAARELFKESPPPKSSIYPHDPRHVKAAWKKVLQEWEASDANMASPHVRIGRADVHFVRHGSLAWLKSDASSFWTQALPFPAAGEGYEPRPSKVDMTAYVEAYGALRKGKTQFERVGRSDIYVVTHYLLDKFYGEYDAFFNSEWYDDDMR